MNLAEIGAKLAVRTLIRRRGASAKSGHSPNWLSAEVQIGRMSGRVERFDLNIELPRSDDGGSSAKQSNMRIALVLAPVLGYPLLEDTLGRHRV